MWKLIILVVAASGGTEPSTRARVDTLPFASQESCNKAREFLVRERPDFPGKVKIDGVCVYG